MGVRVEQKTRTKEPIDIPDDASLQLPCTNDSQQPLTVFVHHHVLRTKHAEFAKWSKEINSIACTYDGFIDSEIIKPVTTSDDDNVNSRTDKQKSDEYITDDSKYLSKEIEQSQSISRPKTGIKKDEK